MQRTLDASDGVEPRADVEAPDQSASEHRGAKATASRLAAGRVLPETRLLLGRASWTLVDQGVVSIGNFALNLQLARDLAAADYGKFALFPWRHLYAALFRLLTYLLPALGAPSLSNSR